MTRRKLIPIFVLCDESEDVSDSVLESATESLKNLYKEVAANSEIETQTRLSIFGFSTSYEEIVPLAKASEITELLGFTSGGKCNLGLAAEGMTKIIGSTVNSLKSLHSDSDTKILRPILLVLIGSNPADEWVTKFENLLDRSAYPAPSTFVYALPAVDEDIVSKFESITSKYSCVCSRVSDWSMADVDAISVLRRSLLDSESRNFWVSNESL